MTKVDYKKDYKELYIPGSMPSMIDVPAMNFIMIDGKGDPNAEEYQNAVSALYSLSYTIKMKGKERPGYYDYAVFPLEGLWWTGDGAFDFDRRGNWLWTAMIRQPEFVTADVFSWVVELTRKKKPELNFSKARFEPFAEGLCVQTMHTGPYSEELATIEKINIFVKANGLVNETGTGRKHREIYLSDPNKTASEKMRTVIRLPVSNQ